MRASRALLVGAVLAYCCCGCTSRASQPADPRDETWSVHRFEAELSSAVDELNSKDSIGILGRMVTLERIDGKPEQEVREDADPLMRRIDEFLESRALRIEFPEDGSSADYFGRALGQRRFDVELRGLTRGASEGRTKLKRAILPILLALKLKALIVLPIVITLIGLIGIKGLGAGLLALLLSGAVALKALLTPAPAYPARLSFAKPYEIHHDHWHRSQEEELVAEQPYRAWTPEFSVDPQYGPYQEIP